MVRFVRVVLFLVLIFMPLVLYFSFQRKKPVRPVTTPVVAPVVKPQIVVIHPVLHKKPKIALIFDDVGDSLKDLRDITSLGIPVTISIIPELHFSKNIAQIAQRSDIAVMVHLPLQPKDAEKSRTNRCKFVKKERGEKANRELLDFDFSSIKGAIAVNNHMGSLATQDADLMRLVISVAKKHGLFFIDSMTSRDSVACKVASELGVLCAENEGFVDSINDEKVIAEKLKELASEASKKGSIIVIAHPRKKTFNVLKRKISELKQEVEFISILDYFNL